MFSAHLHVLRALSMHAGLQASQNGYILGSWLKNYYYCLPYAGPGVHFSTLSDHAKIQVPHNWAKHDCRTDLQSLGLSCFVAPISFFYSG